MHIVKSEPICGLNRVYDCLCAVHLIDSFHSCAEHKFRAIFVDDDNWIGENFLYEFIECFHVIWFFQNHRKQLHLFINVVAICVSPQITCVLIYYANKVYGADCFLNQGFILACHTECRNNIFGVYSLRNRRLCWQFEKVQNFHYLTTKNEMSSKSLMPFT